MNIKERKAALNKAVSNLQRAAKELSRCERAVGHHRQAYNAALDGARKLESARLKAKTLFENGGREFWVAWYECGRKPFYVFRTEALKHCHEHYVPYQCRWCSGWHVGQSVKPGYTGPSNSSIKHKMALYILAEKL